MRVTTQMQVDALVQSITRLQSDQFRTQEAISTGKKVTKPSHDPRGVREITSIRAFLDITKTRRDSMNAGIARLHLSEDAISSTTNVIQRAKEVTLVARNDITTAEDRKLIAKETHQLLLGFVDTANTQIDGRYIFSGYETQTAAYALAAVSAKAISPSITANNGNAGKTTATVSIQTVGSLTGDKFSIEFATATNFNVINKTSGATVLANQTYTSGGNIDFNGLRVVLTNNPSGPLAGDQFAINAHNSSDATVSASISTASALQPHIYEIRFTSTTAYGIVDLTTEQVLSTGNSYTSGGNIIFAGITAVVTNGTTTPQNGDVFRVRTDYSYQGDTGTINIDVRDNQTVAINTVGSRVFSGSDVDLFDILQDLNEAVLVNDSAALDTVIGKLTTGIDQLTDAVASIGARVNRLETIEESMTLLSLNFQSRRSTLEDTDFAKAASQLTLLEASLNGVFLVLERQFQTTLLNFLR